MSIEAGVLIDRRGAFYWHVPENRAGGSLPDSRRLWEIIWINRAILVGFAHSHPGEGVPGPSYEDVTTFSAIELGLGRRLVWWITSKDQCVVIRWAGPDKYHYVASPVTDEPAWLNSLRGLSNY